MRSKKHAKDVPRRCAKNWATCCFRSHSLRGSTERGEFNIDDVIDEVHAKMVRRHPHVFSDTKAGDSAEVLRNWEAIKAEEKRAAGKGSARSAHPSSTASQPKRRR